MIRSMNEGGSTFPLPEIPPALVADLRRQNPWWTGDPTPAYNPARDDISSDRSAGG